MNLGRIERMIQEGDVSREAINYLIGCRGESAWLDYKERLDLGSDYGDAAFTKDALALKNVGGGYLLVGVRDKTWEPIGLSAPFTHDQKQLKDKIMRCSGVTLDLIVSTQTLTFDGHQGDFALILVVSSKRRKKRRMPTMSAKDFCVKDNWGIRRGSIYVRDGDTTTLLTSPERLEELLDELEERADGDLLEESSPTSSFSVNVGLYRLLEKGYESFIGRDSSRKRLIEAVTQDPRLWIINVHGPGGVGKSALVNNVTHHFHEQRTFESIIQLTAKDTKLTVMGIERHSRNLFSIENLLDHVLTVFQEPLSGELDRKRATVTELLSAWSVLIVLDNMETVTDGRIMDFIRSLPPSNRSKVVLTSRSRTGGWELPLPLVELSEVETKDFIRIRRQEMQLKMELSDERIGQIWQVTGGLPLAIQWTLGRLALSNNFNKTLLIARDKDSPVLEFSFRNIWERLGLEAKTVLAILSIFDEPPTIQHLSISIDWPAERLERALQELEQGTLVTPVTQRDSGQTIYTALPITLSFAGHQLVAFGELGAESKKRWQQFKAQVSLETEEAKRFASFFQEFRFDTDNEKRAAVLCRRAESEAFAGNDIVVDKLLKEARDLAPQNAYPFVMTANFLLQRSKTDQALEFAKKAEKRADKNTGSLVYKTLARVYDIQRNAAARRDALQKCLYYDPGDLFARHQFGVALSKVGSYKAAVEEFDVIIKGEIAKPTPKDSVMFALKCKALNLQKLGDKDQAAAAINLGISLASRHPHLRPFLKQFKGID